MFILRFFENNTLKRKNICIAIYMHLSKIRVRPNHSAGEAVTGDGSTFIFQEICIIKII